MAARGRYARNAVIQGSAAELFKVWAVTVRARSQHLGARIVLCLHDELLVLAPAEHAAEVADLVATGLGRGGLPLGAAVRPVRFVADISVVERWSRSQVAPVLQAFRGRSFHDTPQGLQTPAAKCETAAVRFRR